ncbi:MAG: DUF3298 domain-containing protein [Proteiniphilum sp.]|nr:DUF3298 domain-containing protein [Proteiniphilum sp.]
MRTRIILPIVLFVTGSGLMISCGEGGGSRKSSKIEFDSIVVKQQIPLLQGNDTTLPFADVEISFTYPVKFRNAESLARLQQIFQGTFFGEMRYDSLTPREATERYMEEYTTRYESLSNSYYEDKARLEGEMPLWYWYSMSNSNKILFRSDSLLSYAVEYSDYEGGAHGSYRILYTSIDLNELNTISEEDLFVPDYYKPLTEKIIERLMDQYKADNPDSLLMRGFFTIEDIVPNNNFWLNEEGIHYSYNQYEIAPYSMGVINVTVPYADLSDILLPDGIISNYSTK